MFCFGAHLGLGAFESTVIFGEFGDALCQLAVADLVELLAELLPDGFAEAVSLLAENGDLFPRHHQVWSTVWATHIPERLSSRVGACDEFGSFASVPIGQLSVPVLAAAFGTAAVSVTAGALLAAATLMPLLLPSLRRIELDTSKAG